MMLLIATVLPAVGSINKPVRKDNKILAQKTKSDYIPGEFIVKFKKDSSLSSPIIIGLNEKYKVKSIEKVFSKSEGTNLENIYFLHVPEYFDIISIVKDYNLCPDVVYAEPNYNSGYLPIIPNDFYFENQWPLNNTGQYGGTPDCDIDAVEAWDIEMGSSDIVIASVDSGVDYNHEDLAGNIWTNDDEIPGNGIDDDNNGYIDDIVGWDCVENDSIPLDDPSAPQYGHGTRCAGIHSAVTNNNIGIAGVCWYCKTMVVRCYYDHYDTTIYAKGIKYAVDNGANVINIEMCISYHSQLIKDTVDYAYMNGCFMCAAAGNYNTSTPYYPAAYENVTAVGATNQRDEKCDESDWGAGHGSNWGEWLDVAAPGNSLRLLSPNDNYVFFSGGGTSLSSPYVAGLAALLLSQDPTLTPDEVTNLICKNVDPYNSTEYYIGTGRINAYKALMALYSKIYCEGNLEWTDVKAGSTVNGSFIVKNNGEEGSLLIWNIKSYPTDWGTWTFTPDNGTGLSAGGSITVSVSVVAPSQVNTEFTGKVKIINSGNASDFCEIDVSLSTSRNRISNFMQYILERLSFLKILFDNLRRILS